MRYVATLKDSISEKGLSPENCSLHVSCEFRSEPELIKGKNHNIFKGYE